ncbi:MAG: hypothetical protein JWM93_2468 [Frankiales bacterium]|nr:hypothetical protein [Frankiales bacterium]
MASEIELARIAQVLNTLRPKWPVQSCLTILRRHAHHPLADLAVAAVAVAVDELTTTPARLDQPGPWWNLARGEPTPVPPPVSHVLAELEQPAAAPVADGVALCREAIRQGAQ